MNKFFNVEEEGGERIGEMAAREGGRGGDTVQGPEECFYTVRVPPSEERGPQPYAP